VTLQTIQQVLGLALFLPPALFHQRLGGWRVRLKPLRDQLVVTSLEIELSLVGQGDLVLLFRSLHRFLDLDQIVASPGEWSYKSIKIACVRSRGM
jgi:hypothetical protein